VSHEEERLLAGIERFIKRDLKVTPLPELAPIQLVTPLAVVASKKVSDATPGVSAIADGGVETIAPPYSAPTRFGRRRTEPVCALLMPPPAGPAEPAPPTPQP
jgi:hypothetical protein